MPCTSLCHPAGLTTHPSSSSSWVSFVPFQRSAQKGSKMQTPHRAAAFKASFSGPVLTG